MLQMFGKQFLFISSKNIFLKFSISVSINFLYIKLNEDRSTLKWDARNFEQKCFHFKQKSNKDNLFAETFWFWMVQ